LWNATTEKELQRFTVVDAVLGWTAWCPDGKRLALEMRFGPHLLFEPATGIRIWNPATGKRVLTFPSAHSPAWSPDGSILACLDGEGAICLLDSHSGKRLRTVGGNKFDSLDWSPDGKVI